MAGLCWYTHKPGAYGNCPKHFHEGGRHLVFVTSFDPMPSNFVSFARVNQDGTIRDESLGAYDHGQFEPAKEYRLVARRRRGA